MRYINADITKYTVHERKREIIKGIKQTMFLNKVLNNFYFQKV